MRIRAGWRRALMVFALALLGVAVVARYWVVPALVSRLIAARVGGRVEIEDCWIGLYTSGVLGMKIAAASPSGFEEWASADRVTTDLTLGMLLRGQAQPRQVTLERAKVRLEFDREGKLLTPLAWKSGGGQALPGVKASESRLTLSQEGRPEMVISGLSLALEPDGEALKLALATSEKTWGPIEVAGRINPDLTSGRITMNSTRSLHVDPAKLAAIPFVPGEAWKHVSPEGQVDVRLTADLSPSADHRVEVTTEITLRETRVRSDTLDLTAEAATGRVVVKNATVELIDVSGRALGGQVRANGVLDFSRKPASINAKLGLDKIEIEQTPVSWQLAEAGIKGPLTGQVHLVATLKEGQVDLSGSSGDGVVEGGTLQGIPFKSMRLTMKANGTDLQYESPNSSASEEETPVQRLQASLPPAARYLLATGALLVRPAEQDREPEPKPQIKLPDEIHTVIEFEDVDLRKIITRADAWLGYPLNIPIAGRLGLKAKATIPLGKLADLKGYVFHGDLTLTGASLYGVDLGFVDARVDLVEGVLELKDFRGRLVDQPEGGPDHPPPATDPFAAEDPLPPRGFRAQIRAEISPPGRITAEFDGESLPMGEITAPFLPRPTPVSGLATLRANASVLLARVKHPESWTVEVRAQSQALRYQDARLDAVEFRANLNDGVLEIPELAATMNGRPLEAKAEVKLAPPHAFRGSLHVDQWEIERILAWLPNSARIPEIRGRLSADGEASGALLERAIMTKGEGTFKDVEIGPARLEEIPVSWTTSGREARIVVPNAKALGGRINAEATLPMDADAPATCIATLNSVDISKLAGFLPGRNLQLTGIVDGQVDARLAIGTSKLDANARLSAPNLTVQGVPAENLRASVQWRPGRWDYEIAAQSLGGTMLLKSPREPAAPAPANALDAELHAVGFKLGLLGEALARETSLSQIGGKGAVRANLRLITEGPDAGFYVHGISELRDLAWGRDRPLGWLKGNMLVTPKGWRVEPFTGEFLGGDLSGTLSGSPFWAEGVARTALFDIRVDRLSIARALGGSALAGGAEGVGTLRASGEIGDAALATGEIRVPTARIQGLRVSEVMIPFELSSAPGSGTALARSRRWTARVAGGDFQGESRLQIGSRRDFANVVRVANLDLEPVARAFTQSSQPASGRISGRVALEGRDAARPETYRGDLDLELLDASLFSLPVFRELSRFLGAAGGGLFESGELHAKIGGRQFLVETLELQGRVAQLRASGTVGFNGSLDLIVLVNTNQIIPQTGQALAARIPGLGAALGQDRESALRVANFLSTRLLKLRVGGTLNNPSVTLDPAIVVADAATSFFASALKLPLGFIK